MISESTGFAQRFLACFRRGSKRLHEHPNDWSGYRDGRWGTPGYGDTGSTAATAKHLLRRRILHMLERLGIDPSDVPASNLVFLRSRRKATLEGNFRELVDHCWDFHSERILHVNPKVVVCLGNDTREVRRKLGANKLKEVLVEQNNRRWKNRLYEASSGRQVAVLTHPGIADWTVSVTDPTELIASALH